MTTFHFSAALWQHPGEGSWYFISVPADISDDIAHLTAATRKGFGSVRVTAAVGSTVWQTSVFPDSKTGTYLLPVKKAVRTIEDLTPGDAVETRLELAEL
ncbi:DUF1905 domain-containing protein [Kribbella steppae]|uniref:DUF1905 domain-containing protein n=1 Tax=Kribbella steppae TaxID=2512223 RepID=UPI00104D4FF9|nr:DUF1905 domain-containing protein [Kribbella steppae]